MLVVQFSSELHYYTAIFNANWITPVSCVFAHCYRITVLVVFDDLLNDFGGFLLVNTAVWKLF